MLLSTVGKIFSVLDLLIREMGRLFVNFPDGNEEDNFVDAPSDTSNHNFSFIKKTELTCFILVKTFRN